MLTLQKEHLNGREFLSLFYFSLECKNAWVLFKNSLCCIIKCNCSGRDNKELTERINSPLLKHLGSHILKALLNHPYLDTCKNINNVNFSYECKSLQKDAKKPDDRNLSLFQILLKT